MSVSQHGLYALSVGGGSRTTPDDARSATSSRTKEKLTPTGRGTPPPTVRNESVPGRDTRYVLAIVVATLADTDIIAIATQETTSRRTSKFSAMRATATSIAAFRGSHHIRSG